MNVKSNKMKNLILLPIFLLTISTLSFGNTTPEESIKLLDVEEVSITVEKSFEDLFQVAELTKDLSSLKFITNENVQFVQIYNQDGIVEFQLPVDSQNVRINKSFFESGKYKLGFKIDNINDLYFAEVKMK